MLWRAPSFRATLGDVNGATSRRKRLRTQLHDVRSGRVVFLSHCLLNQNTRYPGGAVCPGAVRGVIEPYLDAGVGLVQLPCPEQRTWGGVEKPALLWIMDHPRAARVAAALSGPGAAYMRRRYRRLARTVVRDIADYLDGGFEITGVVGVAGSPTCGVETTLDIACALRALSTRTDGIADPDSFDRVIIQAATVAGAGMFMEALTNQLSRRDLAVPIREVTLSDAPCPLGGAEGI